MSAALLLPELHAAAAASRGWSAAPRGPEAHREPDSSLGRPASDYAERAPLVSLAFYRKHTEKMLRRYLYASMLVGRAPSILNEPVGRGWASSRPVCTFEEAVIFVLDVEKCLAKLGPADRLILARAIVQEYSREEIGLLLRISVRSVETLLGEALDRLTRILLDSGLLIMP